MSEKSCFHCGLDIVKEEEIVFSPVLIHKDDSISQIKKKIINELGELSYDELYLFAYKTRVINMMTALTSSTKSIIYKKILFQKARQSRRPFRYLP